MKMKPLKLRKNDKKLENFTVSGKKKNYMAMSMLVAYTIRHWHVLYLILSFISYFVVVSPASLHFNFQLTAFFLPFFKKRRSGEKKSCFFRSVFRLFFHLICLREGLKKKMFSGCCELQRVASAHEIDILFGVWQ